MERFRKMKCRCGHHKGKHKIEKLTYNQMVNFFPGKYNYPCNLCNCHNFLSKDGLTIEAIKIVKVITTYDISEKRSMK